MRSNEVKVGVLLATVGAFGAMLLASTPARAHVDPPGCSQPGQAIIVSVFRADGVTVVAGTVSECETIRYRATLQKADPSNDSICAFSGGTFRLTTPDGVVHDINLNVPCIGGNTNVEGCDPTVDFIQSAQIPYTVAPGDVISGVVTATAIWTGGVTHDSSMNTPGSSATTPRSSLIVFCDDGLGCTIDACDPALQSSSACSNEPIVCNDNDSCTADTCNPATGQCVFTSVCTPTDTPTNTPTATPTRTLQPNGGACSDPTVCLSGNCVDDVCCADASCPPGESCNNPGSGNVGACSPDPVAPAPAISRHGVLLALAILITIGGAGFVRRRGAGS